MRTLYNTGTINATNNSSVNHILNMPDGYAYEYLVALYNDGGTVTAIKTTFLADSTNSRGHSYNNYAIFNPTGVITINSGTVHALGKTYAYGIWNDSGTVTIGIPEPTNSPNYGRDTADVSTTNPDIKAIGTNTGIGVKNNTGKVYYYDGKITGSTAAMPEKPAGVEYLYEPKDYQDSNGYQYRILEWMREQPGN